MSKKGGPMSKEDREWLSTQIVAASEGLMTVPQAMKTARMQTPDRKNPSVQKRVYRQAKNLVVVDHRLIGTASVSMPASMAKPSDISNTQNGLDNASVSSLLEPPTNSSKETTTTATAEDKHKYKTLPTSVQMVKYPTCAFAPRKGHPPVDAPQSGAGAWQLARLASWGQPAAQLLQDSHQDLLLNNHYFLSIAICCCI